MNNVNFGMLVAFVANFSDKPLTAENVEQLSNMVAPNKVGYVDTNVLNELIRHIYQGRKIYAIKAYRTLTGVGLYEAKTAVEQNMATLNIGVPSNNYGIDDDQRIV